ncbi:MAG TPA: SIS domain-containing protein [Chloroflexota bacterium]|nr:SIS domain-containing protein [Chloroflexota bacterium]
MYSELPEDIRDRHPYHMYDEIKAQPQAIARSLSLWQENREAIRDAVVRARRVWVTGCGTSFHAALAGAWFIRAFSESASDARAVEAYELATYPTGVTKDDVVIALSHSGQTNTTERAVTESPATTIAVTGFPESPVAKAANLVLPTGYPDERSWAHTISYTAALGSLAALANDMATPAQRLDLAALPDLVTDVLNLEEIAHRIAAAALTVERDGNPCRVLLTGAGPNIATAHEGALKLLETGYVAALSFELEQTLHGPLAAVDEETLVAIVAPTGRSVDRAVQAVEAVRRLGCEPMVLTGEESAERFPESHRLVLPELPEVISPIPYVVPLQLLSYFLAIGKGHNPDLIHRDDKRYANAAAAYS